MSGPQLLSRCLASGPGFKLLRTAALRTTFKEILGKTGRPSCARDKEHTCFTREGSRPQAWEHTCFKSNRSRTPAHGTTRGSNGPQQRKRMAPQRGSNGTGAAHTHMVAHVAQMERNSANARRHSAVHWDGSHTYGSTPLAARGALDWDGSRTPDGVGVGDTRGSRGKGNGAPSGRNIPGGVQADGAGVREGDLCSLPPNPAPSPLRPTLFFPSHSLSITSETTSVMSLTQPSLHQRDHPC